jgi:hypothetical protein
VFWQVPRAATGWPPGGEAQRHMEGVSSPTRLTIPHQIHPKFTGDTLDLNKVAYIVESLIKTVRLGEQSTVKLVSRSGGLFRKIMTFIGQGAKAIKYFIFGPE